MTGVHPDSLTSVQVIDLMTTTVLATEMLKKTKKKIFPGMTDSHADFQRCFYRRPNNINRMIKIRIITTQSYIMRIKSNEKVPNVQVRNVSLTFYKLSIMLLSVRSKIFTSHCDRGISGSSHVLIPLHVLPNLSHFKNPSINTELFEAQTLTFQALNTLKYEVSIDSDK